MSDDELDEIYDPEYDDDSDEQECETFGGIGCKYFGCPEWGGDGLCFVQMRAGYGHV